MNISKKNKILLKKLAALLVIASLLLVLPGCGDKKKESTLVPGSSILPAPKKDVTAVETNSSNEIVINGVVNSIDTVSKKIILVDVEENTQFEIPYTGGTDIRNKYDTPISAATITAGQIYTVTCNRSGVAVKIYGHKSSWERDELSDFTVDEDKKVITIGLKEFTYNDSTLILAGGEKLAIANILKQDEVTISGVDNKVYSIIVNKGHGYIKLTGLEAFEGGYVTVGRKQLFSVTSGMLITAQEGTHTIELQNGSLVAEKLVNVENGKEVEVNFGEYMVEATKNGAVFFSVTPADAIMTIDGSEVDFSKEVSLPYGTHKLVLEAHNYEKYTSNFVVNSSYRTIIIDMVSTGTVATKASTEEDLTDGYTVKVTEPAGASLYVDSVYIGVIPCSFDKSSGKKTITLTKSGFQTIGYTISIANASGNLTYAFPDMEADSQTSAETTSAAATSVSTENVESTK